MGDCGCFVRVGYGGCLVVHRAGSGGEGVEVGERSWMCECLIVDVLVCRVSNCGFVIVHSMIPFLPSTCISLYTHLAIVPVICQT